MLMRCALPMIFSIARAAGIGGINQLFRQSAEINRFGRF
jgi:hypothetical protein